MAWGRARGTKMLEVQRHNCRMDKNVMLFHGHARKNPFSLVSFAQAQINRGTKSGFFCCCLLQLQELFVSLQYGSLISSPGNCFYNWVFSFLFLKIQAGFFLVCHYPLFFNSTSLSDGSSCFFCLE